MELILFRHGRAIDRMADQPDETRPLTAEGRKLLKASMAGLERLTGLTTRPVIWSSPLDRAMQTAIILANHFKVKDVIAHAFIGNGDFEMFVKALAESGTDLESENAILIVVGHEPWLGEWCHRLCATRLPFKKGAAAGIRLSAHTSLAGELQWFAQPKVLKRASRI